MSYWLVYSCVLLIHAHYLLIVIFSLVNVNTLNFYFSVNLKEVYQRHDNRHSKNQNLLLLVVLFILHFPYILLKQYTCNFGLLGLIQEFCCGAMITSDIFFTNVTCMLVDLFLLFKNVYIFRYFWVHLLNVMVCMTFRSALLPNLQVLHIVLGRISQSK